MVCTRRHFIGGSFVWLSLLAAACTRRSEHHASSRWPPRRPSGKPKPLLEDDIAPQLARLDAWYASHLPADRYVLNPPAWELQLRKLERQIGLKLPQQYRQLYKWHDGENDDRHGHFYGLPLLPLRQVRSEWEAWQATLVELGGDRYKVRGGAWPKNSVDPAYINSRWLPLTHDGSGNHIGLDFDPWPAGRVGQVILFGRDADTKVVIAESLGRFLAWIADLLEGGNFRLAVEPGERVLREFRLKEPPVDDFQDGARIILGAPST